MGKAKAKTDASGDALARIFAEGVLVDLTIGIPGADRRVDAEAAGVDHDPASKRLVKATARLFDGEAFAACRSIKGQAERALEARGIPGLIHGARFVPAGALAALTAELKVLQAQFAEAVDEACHPGGSYDVRRAAILAEYNGGPLRAEVERRCPTAGQVRGALSFGWTIFGMSPPEVAAERERLAGQAQRWAVERVQALYDEVLGACRHVLELAEKGPVRAQSIDALARVLDRVKAQNVFGAEALEGAIAAARGVAGAAADPGEWRLAGAQAAPDVAALRGAVQAAEAEIARVSAEDAARGFFGRAVRG